MTANKTRPVQATAPKRIYLQGGPQLPENIDFSALSEVTWCRDDVDGTGIPYVRADLAGAAPAAVAPVLDVTLDEEQAGLLRDMLGDPAEYEEAITVRLIVCDGHSGHGLYVAQAEYQDEGAALLAPLPATAAPALEAPAAPTWDKTRDSLVTLLLGLARHPFLNFDVACIALDAATEPGMPLAYMRGTTAAPALDAPAAKAMVGDEQADAYLTDPGRLEALARSHPAGLVRALARAALAAAPQAPAEAQEPAANLHDDGYWTPTKTEAGRALNERLMRAGSPRIPVYTHPAPRQAAPQAPAAPWKDHLTARLVNDLRDCAIKYHGAGQLRDRIAHIVAPLCDQLKAAQAAPAAPAVDAPTPVQALLDMHAALLDANPYAYFELAYTRQTGWMAWITDKPFHGPVINPDRKVLARGQGDTAAEACAAAAQAKEGGEA